MAGKADLVDRIAQLTGIPKTHVAMVYDSVFEITGELLAEGNADDIQNNQASDHQQADIAGDFPAV